MGEGGDLRLGTTHVRDTLGLSDGRGGGGEGEKGRGGEGEGEGLEGQRAELTRRNQSAPNVVATRWHMEASSPAC